MNETQTKQWDVFLDFLKSRKVNFKTYPVFYIYLLFVVMIMGGFSVWTTLYIELHNSDIIHKNICLALMGFSMPLTTSFAIDIFAIEAEIFIKRIFQIICISVPLILLVLFLVYLNTFWAYLFSGINILLSLFFWWIVNSKNSNLCDESYYSKNRKEEIKLEQTLENI
jgi:hypothetical protein